MWNWRVAEFNVALVKKMSNVSKKNVHFIKRQRKEKDLTDSSAKCV